VFYAKIKNYVCYFYFHINEKIEGELRNNLVSERKERILELEGEKGSLKFNMLSKDTIQYFQISFVVFLIKYILKTEVYYVEL